LERHIFLDVVMAVEVAEARMVQRQEEAQEAFQAEEEAEAEEQMDTTALMVAVA